HSLLAVVGGNFYYDTPIIFQYQGEPSIWFNRDEDGYLLLNVRMLSTSGQPRTPESKTTSG
ncbi:MAG: HNH endonuclease, partial [Actinomycetota bacterium]|nr:HNH endonuclease [Actinomycetota bacterium]